MGKRKAEAYAEAGVDIAAGDALVERIAPLVKATARPGADGALGGFGGIFDLAALRYRDPLLVAANDGVGTKLRIAIATGIHDTVGVDLVAMCVNDLVVQGAEPLFFLDYFASSKLAVDVAANVVAGIAKGCQDAGCALIGGETAEMPSMYADGDYDLAGFAVGAVERDGLLPRADLQAGDVVLGLASNGFHSNGFSLIRKVLADQGLDYEDEAAFMPGHSFGKALLEPTRIYVKPLLETQRQTSAIKALAHITGGGLTENLPRVLPDHLRAHIDLGAIEAQTCFRWIAEAGGISEADMLSTFNCGVGMTLIASSKDAAAVSSALSEAGETVLRIGHLEQRAGEAVTYAGSLF